MKVLTKEYLLSLIEEQERSLNEWPKYKTEKTQSGWTFRELDEPVRFEVPGKNVASKNPETGEVEQDVIYSNIVRISPNNKELYEFTNENSLNKQKYKVELYDPHLGEVYASLPRKSYYGSTYIKKEKVEKPELYDIGMGYDPMGTEDEFKLKQIAGENAAEFQKRQLRVERGRWAKMYVIFPIVNSFFSNDSIRKKLAICGIPRVVADRNHTEPISLRVPRMNFIGKTILSDIQNLQFSFHAVRDESGINDAIEKIYDKRMMIAHGEMPPDDEDPDYNRRQYAHLYPGSHWEERQRVHGEPYFQETPIYRLPMKGVQKGKMAFNVLTSVNFVGNIRGNEYELHIEFIVDKNLRPAKSQLGEKRGNLIEPLRVSVSEPLPDFTDRDDFTINPKTGKFFAELLRKGLKELGTKILELDPDEVMGNLRIIGADVDPDYQF